MVLPVIDLHSSVFTQSADNRPERKGPLKEPDVSPSGSLGSHALRDSMAVWARHHGVDEDLALLICACTAAHAAGPKLDFEGRSDLRRFPAPTVIATAGDTGFHKTVKAAIEPLQEIQSELIEEYGEPSGKSVSKGPAKSARDRLEEALHRHEIRNMPCMNNPARGMTPDTQPAGPVRFVLEGSLPAKPVPLLKRYHHYAALSVAEIERLPCSDRSRHKRVYVLLSSVRGYYHGNVCIRGFMRFTPDDLEWMTDKYPDLLDKTLPLDPSDDQAPVPLAGRTGEVQAFAHLHREALDRIVSIRFEGAECAVDFRIEEAGRRFRELREGYRAEAYAVGHLAPASIILPDLFVWYLLQLGKSAWLDIDESEVAVHAIAAARRLRRRVAEFHDRHVAARRARERMALATKLVARMRSLSRPCKRRDLVRGFDKQRLDRLSPVIDLLVDLGVFTRASGWLRMNAAGESRGFRMEDFMEPLADVPISVTHRLKGAEQRQAALTESIASS